MELPYIPRLLCQVVRHIYIGDGNGYVPPLRLSLAGDTKLYRTLFETVCKVKIEILDKIWDEITDILEIA